MLTISRAKPSVKKPVVATLEDLLTTKSSRICANYRLNVDLVVPWNRGFSSIANVKSVKDSCMEAAKAMLIISKVSSNVSRLAIILACSPIRRPKWTWKFQVDFPIFLKLIIFTFLTYFSLEFGLVLYNAHDRRVYMVWKWGRHLHNFMNIHR